MSGMVFRGTPTSLCGGLKCVTAWRPRVFCRAVLCSPHIPIALRQVQHQPTSPSNIGNLPAQGLVFPFPHISRRLHFWMHAFILECLVARTLRPLVKRELLAVSTSRYASVASARPSSSEMSCCLVRYKTFKLKRIMYYWLTLSPGPVVRRCIDIEGLFRAMSRGDCLAVRERQKQKR